LLLADGTAASDASKRSLKLNESVIKVRFHLFASRHFLMQIVYNVQWELLIARFENERSRIVLEGSTIAYLEASKKRLRLLKTKNLDRPWAALEAPSLSAIDGRVSSMPYLIYV